MRSEHNDDHCLEDLRTARRTICSEGGGNSKNIISPLSPLCKQPLEYYYRQTETERQGKGKLSSSILEIYLVFHREKAMAGFVRWIESVEEETKRICHMITLRWQQSEAAFYH